MNKMERLCFWMLLRRTECESVNMLVVGRLKLHVIAFA